MFVNSLTGLSEDGKKKFDQVCVHLNGVLRNANIKFLDGEEDQILIDLWMDTFPYKLDADGNRIPKVIREKSNETIAIYEMDADGNVVLDKKGKPVVVGGKNVEVYKERTVWELDFERSLIESTSVGIYKWRGEQLLLNKIKYLFGDRRTRKTVGGKVVTEVQIDAWGNERIRAVFEEEVDPKKISKRDLSLKINESDLVRPDGEAMTLDDIGICDSSAQMDFDHTLLMCALRGELSEIEMNLVDRLLGGESINQLYKSDTSLTTKAINALKVKVARALGREDLLVGRAFA